MCENKKGVSDIFGEMCVCVYIYIYIYISQMNALNELFLLAKVLSSWVYKFVLQTTIEISAQSQIKLWNFFFLALL